MSKSTFIKIRFYSIRAVTLPEEKKNMFTYKKHSWSQTTTYILHIGYIKAINKR